MKIRLSWSVFVRLSSAIEQSHIAKSYPFCRENGFVKYNSRAQSVRNVFFCNVLSKLSFSPQFKNDMCLFYHARLIPNTYHNKNEIPFRFGKYSAHDCYPDLKMRLYHHTVRHMFKVHGKLARGSKTSKFFSFVFFFILCVLRTKSFAQIEFLFAEIRMCEKIHTFSDIYTFFSCRQNPLFIFFLFHKFYFIFFKRRKKGSENFSSTLRVFEGMRNMACDP